ncbi:MAG: hypothetical protein ROZ09_04510 [Thiobacillus sp.]|jgi:hypothetical protein|uniref:hypothetical protein n=1 Tax=Thiobacillus sp. TaxID=924 RepID=UPI002894A99F|nr:hypothetical protein [Thiobacillus sp.]MDT3706064.1 hypothetical protein [Thiobacillus sp.]
MKPNRFSIILIFLFLAFSLSAAVQAANTANETLLEATSPFEDMVDLALARNDASITKALADATRQSAAVKAVLPAAAASRFDKQLQTLHKAASGKDYQTLASTAADAFRLLIDGLRPDHLKVPKEVSLLDYSGFKLRALAIAARPDWNAMRKIAAAASVWWQTIEPGVSDKALRDAFSSTVAGLREATKNENLPMLRFAVQIDLDLVDLLEKHFEQKR